MEKKKISLTNSQADVQPIKSNIMTNCQSLTLVTGREIGHESGVTVQSERVVAGG